MRAVRLHPPGGVDGLRLEEIDPPSPGPGDTVVRVHAAAITRDELDWPTDRLPAIPSYESSGVVEVLADDVEGVAVGDEVFALHGFDRDGAAADLSVVAAAFLAPKPRSLGHVESAAIPLAGLSAWQALFDHGRLEAGQRVLIHGAAGGVGGFAVQLAKHHGAYVVGTASTRNTDAVRDLGADEIVDHTAARFEDVVEPVDVVFDTVGGALLERSPAVLKPGGRLVSIATEPPVGSGGVYFVVEPNRDQLTQLARLADDGALRPAIDAVFPLEESRAAFERSLETTGRRGKIVLEVTEG
jgi:NADPH:quinone reductase-like Zn-dependent oxidoreductase